MIDRKLILTTIFAASVLVAEATAEDSYLVHSAQSEHDIEFVALQTLDVSLLNSTADNGAFQDGVRQVGCCDTGCCGDGVGCCDAVGCCDSCCYLSFFGGWQDLRNYTGEGTGGNDRQIGWEQDGYLLGLSLGRRLADNMRIECELTYREDSATDYSLGNIVNGNFVPFATFNAIGDVHSISTMANLLYDFNGIRTKMKPYVGFGFGGVFVDGEIATSALGRTDSFTGDAFAYQLIAGVSRKFCHWAEGYAEYRYFGTSAIDIDTLAGANIGGEFDYESSNVLFGIRLTLP